MVNERRRHMIKDKSCRLMPLIQRDLVILDELGLNVRTTVVLVELSKIECLICGTERVMQWCTAVCRTAAAAEVALTDVVATVCRPVNLSSVICRKVTSLYGTCWLLVVLEHGVLYNRSPCLECHKRNAAHVTLRGEWTWDDEWWWRRHCDVN